MSSSSHTPHGANQSDANQSGANDSLDALGTPKLFRPLEKFLHIEAAGGIALLAAVATALIWANWPGSDSYAHAWHAPIGLHLGDFTVSQPLHFYINDALMTVFFLVVGLEIRREMVDGALASLRLTALPLAAAIGGIVVPACIFAVLNSGDLREGWAVPTATDIAFAIGILTLLGARVPVQLRALLLAIAIIDDIGAILVIALFYSSGVQFIGLAIAAAGVLLVYVFQYVGIRTALPYVVPGAVVWVGILQAGVHPTIAGVILGLLTPVATPVDRNAMLDGAAGVVNKLRKRFAQNDTAEREHHVTESLQQLKDIQREMLPPVVRVETALHPWVAFGIMPLFALANAGVVIDRAALTALIDHSVSIGIAVGLVAGKPIGIVLFSLLAVRLRIAALPGGVDYRGLSVIGCLGGIGFTMSIFLSQLAFADDGIIAIAKTAVLFSSAAAALLGLGAGMKLLSRNREITT